MTPDPEPDPEPEPEPTTRTIHVKGTTTLNNTHMFRLVNSSTNEVLNGGTVTINQYTNWDISLAEGVGMTLAIKSKGYNNSYPNYTDSYYDDATALSFGGFGYVNISAGIADGSTVTITQNDSTTATKSWS